MTVVPFGDYRPDLSDINSEHTALLSNVIPRGDGYGPFRNVATFTDQLPAACRGYFFASMADGSVAIFAGTETRLYLLDNTTMQWADVSKSGAAYASVDHDRHWKFAQFNNLVIAVQRNAEPQVYNLISSTQFANLAGSPPQAGHVAVVNRFVVLCDLLEFPYRVQWSGLNDPTTWTPGVSYSDYQDLPTGGVPKMILGGELGVIMQDTEIRRMLYAAGSDVVFQIDKVADATGIMSGTAAAAAANNRIYAYSTSGFISIGMDGSITPIGLERIDRTFARLFYDDNSPKFLIAAADPQAGIVVWSYRSISASPSVTGFDHLIAYDYNLQRWSPPIDIEGDFVASLAQPGLTLEGLDAVFPGAATVSNAASNGSGLVRLTVSSTAGWATGDYKTISGVVGTIEANGTWPITVIDATHIDLEGSVFTNTYVSGGIVAGSIDAGEVSFDSFSTSTVAKLSIADSEHRIGFLNGSTLEARMSIPESNLDAGYRVDINGMIPVTDADVAYGYIASRNRASEAVSYSAEQQKNADGFIPSLVNARLGRATLRIPAGELWTFATGIEPVFQRAGRY